MSSGRTSSIARGRGCPFRYGPPPTPFGRRVSSSHQTRHQASCKVGNCLPLHWQDSGEVEGVRPQMGRRRRRRLRDYHVDSGRIRGTDERWSGTLGSNGIFYRIIFLEGDGPIQKCLSQSIKVETQVGLQDRCLSTKDGDLVTPSKELGSTDVDKRGLHFDKLVPRTYFPSTFGCA